MTKEGIPGRSRSLYKGPALWGVLGTKRRKEKLCEGVCRQSGERIGS